MKSARTLPATRGRLRWAMKNAMSAAALAWPEAHPVFFITLLKDTGTSSRAAWA
jgi:hypothetical protein